jgi:hypothetical protein
MDSIDIVGIVAIRQTASAMAGKNNCFVFGFLGPFNVRC